jgi:hypothetical protein
MTLKPHDPSTFPTEIRLSKELSNALWYMPQAIGGRVIPMDVQEQMAGLGLVAKLPDGRYTPTIFGDQVRLGRIRTVQQD